MKLRSNGDGASTSKGKSKLKYRDSSDEDDYGEVPSSDSDSDVSSDGGISDSSEKAEEEDNTCGEWGSHSSEKAEEEEGERYTDTDIQNVIGMEPGKIEFSGGIAEEFGSKYKGGKKNYRPVLLWKVLEQENNRWMKENLHIDTEMINQDKIVMETFEPSDDLIIPLLTFQKEWLAWAYNQEESTARGGILADEMGMGKTLQAIALILFRRSISTGIPDPYLPSSSRSSSRELPPIKGTLVICPLAVLEQWVREIEQFTLKGSTKVLVYHGAKRAKKLPQLSDYDFVITTYPILVAEFRKCMMPPKAKCQYCGSVFKNAHRLKIHLHDCLSAVRTVEQPKSKDMSEIEVHTSKINRDKGKNNASGHKETENDFSTGSSDVTGQISPEGKSILHSVAWERIVLDEAHSIKKRRSNKANAVLALQSRYRWALSGTPLQNRVGDLYVLIRFLQIVPYSYYFCKDCNCRTLDHGSTSPECLECPHEYDRHFCWWNRYISRPIQKYAKKRGDRGPTVLLNHKILKSFMLRRTKKGRIADLNIPPKTETLRRDSLDAYEEDYYTALYNKSQAQFNTYVEAGTLMNNYSHVFGLLTGLRQAVNHPYLVEYSHSIGRKGKAFGTHKELICLLCNEPEVDAVVTSCRHVFCKLCWVDFTHNLSMDQYSCPKCAKPLASDFITNKDGNQQRSKTTIEGFRPSSILNRIQLDNFQTSTKTDALMEEVRFMFERDGSAKAIVFSQFLPFLDLIHYAFQKSGVHCVQLDGSMSKKAKDTAIKNFTEDPSCRIFLASLRAGGVGLNLTVASHVFLMDPCWNPALEWQAQDRIHRIGQHKPTRVVRFIIKNTIEERILKLQEKKALMFEGTVGGSLEALETVIQEYDLRFLFVT